MPTKVKGLEYQANEPAFLQRMRAQNTGGDGRHERPVPRPRRGKNNDDEDDAPAYVMEDTNDILSKDDFEKMKAGEDGQAVDTDANISGEMKGDGPHMSGALPSEDGKATAGGDKPSHGRAKEAKVGLKKRKAAAVVGQTDDHDDEDKTQGTAPSKKAKKKGKPIKLSFDDD